MDCHDRPTDIIINMSRSYSGKARFLTFVIWCAIPLALGVFFTYISPRPYFLAGELDQEHFNYFTAKLLFNGYPIATLVHPGLTTHFISLSLMSILSDSLDSIQQFFNAGYLFIALITTLSMAFFYFKVLRKFEIGIAAICMAIPISGPSYITFANLYSSESLFTFMGLVTITLFWLFVKTKHRDASYCKLIIMIAVSCGLCLATKHSMIFFVFAVMAGALLHILNSDTKWSCKVIDGAVISLVSLATYFACFLPFLKDAPDLSSPEVGVSILSFEPFAYIQDKIANLTDYFPLFSYVTRVSILIALGLLLYAAGNIFSLSRISAVNNRHNFDFWAAAGAIAIGLVGLFVQFSVPLTSHVYDWGHDFRYIAPSVFIVLLPLLCLGEIIGRREFRKLKLLVYGLNIIILLVSAGSVYKQISDYIVFRQANIQAQLEKSAAVTAILAESNAKDGLIVFWDGSPGYAFGPASFQIYGNYKYANNFFDQELNNKFPNLRGLHFYEMGSMITRPKEEVTDLGPVFGQRFRYRKVADLLKQLDPKTLPVTYIFTEYDDKKRINKLWEDLLERTYYGTGAVWEIKRVELDGQAWYVISVRPGTKQPQLQNAPY